MPVTAHRYLVDYTTHCFRPRICANMISTYVLGLCTERTIRLMNHFFKPAATSPDKL